MPKDFTEPLDDTLRILTDYDTKTIQIAKEGECTGYKNDKDEYDAKPEDKILTYQYIEVARDIAVAGGDEYVDSIIDNCTNGVLFKRLRKMVKRWEGNGSVGDQLYNVARHKNVYCTPKDEPQEFNEFLTEFMILEKAVDIEARKAVEMRAKVRKEMDDDFFGRETLYHYMVLNQHHMCDIRNLLAFVRRDSLFSDNGQTKDEQIWEIQKHFDALPGVPSCRDLEPVCVTLGAVSIDSLSPGKVAPVLNSCGDSRWDTKDPHFCDMLTEAAISYGCRAVLEEKCFLSEQDAVGWALDAYRGSRITLGFQLDAAQNRMGSDGWSFLKGER